MLDTLIQIVTPIIYFISFLLLKNSKIGDKLAHRIYILPLIIALVSCIVSYILNGFNSLTILSIGIIMVVLIVAPTLMLIFKPFNPSKIFWLGIIIPAFSSSTIISPNILNNNVVLSLLSSIASVILMSIMMIVVSIFFMDPEQKEYNKQDIKFRLYLILVNNISIFGRIKNEGENSSVIGNNIIMSLIITILLIQSVLRIILL